MAFLSFFFYFRKFENYITKFREFVYLLVISFTDYPATGKVFWVDRLANSTMKIKQPSLDLAAIKISTYCYVLHMFVLFRFLSSSAYGYGKYAFSNKSLFL